MCPALHIGWQGPRALAPKDLLRLTVGEASNHASIVTPGVIIASRGALPNKGLQLTAAGSAQRALVALGCSWVPQRAAGPRPTAEAQIR